MNYIILKQITNKKLRKIFALQRLTSFFSHPLSIIYAASLPY